MATEVRALTPTFGEITLQSANNGSANWCQSVVSPLDQKGNNGWLACLYGGVQTGDDWARVVIPVNEVKLPEISLVQWSYYMTNAESMGANIVFWVHDPTNFDKRAEITQVGGHADLVKTAGWNAFSFTSATGGMFFYGEGDTGTDLIAGTQYTWSRFMLDTLFKGWTIYRITIEYGWEASGTFEEVWIADIKVNKQMLFMKPDSVGTGRIAQRLVSVDTGAVAFTIAPKTPYKLLSMDVHSSAVLDTGEALTLTKDAGASSFFDTLIFSQDLFIGSVISLHVVFGDGYCFPAEDEIDLAQANGSNDDLGITLIYQTVFS